MKPHNAFLTESEKRVFAAVSSELYAEQIAEIANVDVQTVYRTVRKFDLVIKKFKRELTEEQKETIRSMASPMVGIKEISETVGCTRYQAKCFIEKENLPRRRSKSLHKKIPMELNGVFNVDSAGKHYTWLV